MILRLASPNEPKISLVANAQVLKSVAGAQALPLGSPTTFGRDTLNTVPPPSELDRSFEMSVGVNQFPVEAVVMPATCQSPIIRFRTPVAFPAIALFFPKGSSYA